MRARVPIWNVTAEWDRSTISIWETTEGPPSRVTLANIRYIHVRTAVFGNAPVRYVFESRYALGLPWAWSLYRVRARNANMDKL